MRQRAEQEIQQRIEMSGEVLEIKELCLDGIEIRTLSVASKRALERCKNLEYLTLNDCDLRSLDNFPKLSQLIGLELSSNQLTGQDLGMLSNVGQVNFLALDSNRLGDLAYLDRLRCLPQLEILEVHHNELAENEGYRQHLFARLQGLSSVDCKDRLGNETREAEDDYITDRHRSRPHLSDCEDDEDEEDEEISLEHQMGRAQPVKMVKREERGEPVGKFEWRKREQDSDEEGGNDMISQFKQRMAR